MSELTLLCLLHEKQGILDALQKFGQAEVIDLDQERQVAVGALAERVAENNRAIELNRQRSRLKAAIKHLERRYELKPVYCQMDLSAFLEKKGMEADVLALLDRYEELLQREQHLQNEQTRLQEEQRLLEPWLGQSLDLGQRSSSKVEWYPGTMRRIDEVESLRQTWAAENLPIELEVLKQTEQSVLVLALAHRSAVPRLRGDLAQSSFSALAFEGRKGTPAELSAANATRLTAIAEELRAIDQDLADMGDHRLDFMLLSDMYYLELEQLQFQGQVDRSRYTFMLRAWVPSKQAEDLVAKLREHFTVATSIRVADKSEHYPVLLHNAPFNRDFEPLVEMFGAPSTTEQDPTPIMAPFSFLFFGMMLSDVGYGLMLTAITAYLMLKKESSEGMKRLSKMLFLCGISSTFWGFFFGGFFGNLVTKVSNGAVNFPVLWFDPMKDPISLMMWSMIFGVVHLFFGMGIDIYNRVQRGETFSAIVDVVPWYFVVTGLGMMLGASSLPPILGTIAPYLAIAGAVVLVLFGGREAKNPIMRLLKGIMSLYGITGYLGDILSYTRILALVLATSVIAMVVNEIGMLMGPSVIGYIVFAIVAVFGHTVNLSLSALSAYVHSSRLQYVEFFGKFYESGGRFFKPLRLKTDFIHLSARKAASSKTK